jgi:hypothetical protein
MAGMSGLAGVGNEREAKNVAKASVASGDLVDGYLGELRRRLESAIVRNSRARVGQIVAEAEDHLREAAAASVAAGLSERDAQHAAIAAFGGARTVARAHWPSATAVLATMATALLALLGCYALIASVAGALVGWWATPTVHVPGTITLGSRLADRGDSPAGYAASFVVAGLIGVALLAACVIVRRRRRANGGAAAVMPLPGLFYPVAAAGTLLLAPLAVALHGPHSVLWHLSGGFQLAMGSIIACGVLSLACALWSAVLLARWIAARVKASRQPILATA